MSLTSSAVRLNPAVTGIEPSVIRAIAAKKQPGTIDLGLGEPTLLPQQRFIDAAARWVAENGVKYTVNAGDLALRERIAAHYAYPGMSAGKNVCVTTGSQEAVYVAIKTLLDPARDELLVVEPAFPAYAKMAQLEGVAHRAVALAEEDGFAYDVDAILEAIGPRTRVIVIGSPANPTGRVLRDADARRLAEALLARDGEPIWVLHDEIYRELTYIDDPGYVARYYPYTVVANSLSKSNALTGMRIGWLLAPDSVIDTLVKTHAWVTSTASAFGQRVAYEIFGEPGAIEEQSAWYRTQREGVLRVLDASGLRYVPIDGAFYVCVRLPNGGDSIAAAYELVEHRGVAAIPGRIFGPSLEGWLRLSWVAPIDDVAAGLRRVAALR
ncbi:MAG TPA: pyridoxal phosphate-dependent aminotransferase [Candidatus Sulfotelmatobacter sp.]|nr:pyridoxal phosphate-dependent aminotransferase [Candidatus Sulfotelmatobacter sp.]